MAPCSSDVRREGQGAVDRIWIVAGGPSARSCNLSLLQNEFVIAVNDAWFALPSPPAAVVSVDRDWIARHHHRAGVSAVTDAFFLNRESEDPWFLDARCHHFRVAPKLSESWDYVHTGGCSGYAALNVAYLMKPKFIGLIGFDYDASGRHWFDDEARIRNTANTWQRWAEAFDSTKEQLKNIEVINFNPVSQIKAFMFQQPDTLETWLPLQKSARC